MWIPLIAALVAFAQEPAAVPYEVLVVRDHAPVAGAEVRWFEGSVPQLDFGRVDDLARASGHVTKTGVDGRAKLALSNPDVTFVASAPGLWGCERAHWGPVVGGTCGLAAQLEHSPNSSRSEREMTLRLLPDRDLVVDVVDADGHPVGDAPLALRCRTTSVDMQRPLIALATNSDPATGRAVFRHALVAVARATERLKPQAEDAWTTGRTTWQAVIAWRVVVVSTTDAPGPMDWDRLAMPSEPQRLEVGPSGELEVELVDGDGLPARGVESVFLVDPGSDSRSREAALRNAMRWSASPDGFSFDPLPAGVMRAEVREGRALFRCVELGRELLAVARRNEVSMRNEWRVTSPSKAGERVVVPLKLGAGLVTLRMRLVHEGKPLNSMRWDFGAIHRYSPLPFAPTADPTAVMVAAWGHVDSDAFGELRIDCDAMSSADGFRVASPPGAPQPFEFFLDAKRRAPGWTDLGDIEVPLAPLAFSGTVVDDLGVGVPNVEVDVLYQSASEQRSDVLGRAPDGLLASAFRLRTDLSGRFALFTALADEFSAACVGPDARVVSCDEIPRGTTDVRLVRRAFADVRGYLRLGSGRQTSGLTLYLLRVDETDDLALAPGTSRFCACDGVFEFPRVFAGKYLLQVKERDASGQHKLVFMRSDIQVAGGQTTDLGEIVIR